MLLPSTIFDKLGPVGRQTCLVRSPSGIPTQRPWSCLSLSTFLFSKMTKEPKAHGGTPSVIVVLLFVETVFRSWGPAGTLMTAVTAECLLCSRHALSARASILAPLCLASCAPGPPLRLGIARTGNLMAMSPASPCQGTPSHSAQDPL